MTEEQFWSSNPRIIKVYEKIYREKTKKQNEMIHLYVGSYVQSALFTAIDGVLNGRKAKAKYIEKPVEIFEPTKEDKEKEKLRAIAQFRSWAKSQQNKYKGKEDKDGNN